MISAQLFNYSVINARLLRIAREGQKKTCKPCCSDGKEREYLCTVLSLPLLFSFL